MKKIIIFSASFIIFFFLPFVTSKTYAANTCPSLKNQAIVKSLFNDYWRQYHIDNIKRGLDQGNIQVLYSAQSDLGNLIEMTANCPDTEIVSELADIFLTAYPYLSDGQWNSGNSGKEVFLVSSLFTYSLTRLTNIIANTPQSQRTTTMNDFLTKYVTVIANNYDRWLYRAKIFQVRGWGCTNRSDFTFYEYAAAQLARTLGTEASYCNAIWGKSMVGGVGELLAASKIDPRNVFINSSIKSGLQDYVDLAVRLILSRLTRTTCGPGNNESCLEFDVGVWTDHPEDLFAGYTGATFPTTANISKVATITSDIGHFSEEIIDLESLYRHRETLGLTFPSTDDMKAFSNQFVYRVFNGNYEYPRFSNYMDGSNGWYKVDLDNHTGYPPYGVSESSFVYSKFGLFFGEFDSRIVLIMNQLWNSNFQNWYYTSTNYLTCGTPRDCVGFMIFLPNVANPSSTIQGTIYNNHCGSTTCNTCDHYFNKTVKVKKETTTVCTTTSDVNGYYSCSVPAGTYTVSVDGSGETCSYGLYSCTHGCSTTVSVDNGATTTQYFTVFPIPAISCSYPSSGSIRWDWGYNSSVYDYHVQIRHYLNANYTTTVTNTVVGGFEKGFTQEGTGCLQQGESRYYQLDITTRDGSLNPYWSATKNCAVNTICSTTSPTPIPSPTPTPTIFVCIRGELGNLDCSTNGCIDTSDFELFRQDFGKPVSQLNIPSNHHSPDLIIDSLNYIDTADFEIFRSNFGRCGK